MSNSYLKLDHSELGKPSVYDDQYHPDKLFAIPRKPKRDELGIPAQLPFFGFDLWNHYEVSWLNENGKPIVALAEIHYGCETPCIIESKSMKLYFNSLNNTAFPNVGTVRQLIANDIQIRVGGPVWVAIKPLHQLEAVTLASNFDGICLDHLDIACVDYQVNPALLKTAEETVEETLYSDLLKSNCLITQQPDWASIQIAYRGKKIEREGLLQYIVSFRNHKEFHEQCIERIFMDILNNCQPTALTVYGKYTRRGGLDINAYRSTMPIQPQTFVRLCRQ